jgi:tetratricopeptide (TPR) repeat protein
MRGLCAALLLAAWCAAAVAQQAEPPPATPQGDAASPPQEQGRPIPGIRPLPQAQSPEESAAYEKFRTEQQPAGKIRLIEDFLLQFPDSQFKEFAYQAAMQAYQTENDYNRMLTYGELTLAENPDNLPALLVLASAMAETTSHNDPDQDEKLDEGDEYAARALDVLARTRKPPGVPEASWTRTQNESASAAHAARGLIALVREDFPKAEVELKSAVDLAARPDAILLYRLGMCYSFQKKYDEALEVLRRSAAMGGVKVAGPDGKPRDLVAEALEFAGRSRSSATPPAAETPIPGPPQPLANPGGDAPAGTP